MPVRMQTRLIDSIYDLPGRKEFTKSIARKYGVRVIDAINLVKRGFKKARRSPVSLSVEAFYHIVESATADCLKALTKNKNIVDVMCFNEKIEELIGRFTGLDYWKVGIAHLEAQIKAVVDEIYQLLMDYCLMVRDREYVEKLFNQLEQTIRQAKDEIETLLNIREFMQRIEVDYAKMIREARERG